MKIIGLISFSFLMFYLSSMISGISSLLVAGFGLLSLVGGIFYIVNMEKTAREEKPHPYLLKLRSLDTLALEEKVQLWCDISQLPQNDMIIFLASFSSEDYSGFRRLCNEVGPVINKRETEQKSQQTPPKPENAADSKEKRLRQIFSEMAEEPPSKHFVTGVVFDFVRHNYNSFAEAVADCDMMFLQAFFVKAYDVFLNNPSALGAIPGTVNKEKNDTNPMRWNMTVKALDNGDAAFLCYMPVQSDTLAARIFGIALGSEGESYYYCMLPKDEKRSCTVVRNKAMAGFEFVGSVRGRGFELMDSFLECIRKDYYA